MGKNLIETIMGAVVLVVAVLFVMFVYDQRTVSAGDGYQLRAAFDDVSGIGTGSEVRIGGIKVGTVVKLSLQDDTYRPMLAMQVRKGVKLPTDSSAAIVSESLLGGKYVSLQPGADDAMLATGDEIRYTQSAVNLEEMIGKFMFSGGGVESGDAKSDSSEEPSFLD